MSRRLAQGYQGEATTHTPVETVAVVALGANLGDRAATIDDAVRALARLPLTTDVRAAPPIESVAVTLAGPDASAPAYLNTVALVTTRLAPSVLLSYLHAIEAQHGRERRERWGDRTLDLDLIAYGDVRSDEPALQVPHPRAAERDFVLGPWLAIDPDAVLPGVGRVAELLARLRGDAGQSADGGDTADAGDSGGATT
ncbi:MAG: 2-amino-4-hydroxy-6-hydroxymethyldihydropteridine diphosphokinase [Microbacterium sp. SCN 70-200]|uniref:2-amino-4-hydroxy-6- hydroxymethyldihydropteridine diphosphokinase n=1 Tax=unclassified Microbacterium TaxID=2609290 RepID=UPI0008696689|nr:MULTISPECIES: 2-amino-4-hydroxy-6-hydroxymethyldihydropteridine diphosphokinase [unclassified Microbacterium]MBN9215352.1 2-amino-4-hydroxy-6-hydroxymethyldihydropteridine diphosphokinase [Microbacterium sp.]ODT42746.1 MAG: 2-amino-4-hydroxy-6-hydroxymethyldihydropteridine diphosphokinase [Microbacterium sp. SCN 70-200]OJV79780.1 MAG: 2-amino-4-hydroxy-6-hydroxymethyldihydropteridine diphosphokinase [Microbacterium sp. 70-16]